MTIQMLNEAINLVDDDLISAAYSTSDDNKSISFYKYIAVAAAIAIVLTAVILGTKGINKPIVEPATNPGEQFGGDINLCEISDSDIIFENSTFADDEVKTFIEENKFLIADAIAIEYQVFDKPIKIAVKGYTPVHLGETNKLILNSLTLPIMIDDKIVGSVTLNRTDGEISYSVSAQGGTWDRLTNALKENSDVELAFFYVNLYREIAITPDNKVYQILTPVELHLDENVDYYNKFKTEYNVYSWSVLNDENNYVVVDMSEVDLHSDAETQNNDTINIAQTSDIIKESTTKISDSIVITDDFGEMIELKLEDVLIKEVSSMEINSGTRLLLEQKPIKVSDSQKEKIISYISSIKYTEANDYKKGFGGSYSVKLNYVDGSSVEIVFMDKYFCIYSPDGHSTVYADETENSKNLIYYIIELISQ